jgi:hypothetical protein
MAIADSQPSPPPLRGAAFVQVLVGVDCERASALTSKKSKARVIVFFRIFVLLENQFALSETFLLLENRLVGNGGTTSLLAFPVLRSSADVEDTSSKADQHLQFAWYVRTVLSPAS